MKRWRCRRHSWIAVALLLCGHVGSAFSGTATSLAAAGASPKIISVWTHAAPGYPEFAVLQQTVEQFNRRQHVYRIELTSSLRRDYESWVLREAASGTLPCVLEFDGPFLAEFAWPQYLQPIDRFVSASMLKDFLPSIIAQGTYQGRLYSLGQYESGIGLWGNRRHLRAAGIRIPTLNKPWSLEEFEQALAKLIALTGIDYAINFSFYAKGSEFYSYSYSPILQGFGGDLIDRRNYLTAKGVIDGPQSVAAMTHLQRWVEQGWTRPIFEQRNDFEQGKVALSWTGYWVYFSYYKALGKDLVLMPLPDFGRGIKTGVGGWNWGITSTCPEPAGAWAFLEHLLSADEILRLTNANGGVPARRSALARSPLYGPHGALQLFVRQLEAHGVPRPSTPAYGTIRKTFTTATRNIITGSDVQAELSKSADIIDRTIAAHRGYPYP